MKVSGPTAACDKAVAELSVRFIFFHIKVVIILHWNYVYQSHKKVQLEQREQRAPRAAQVTKTVSVPLKYHHAVSSQLFRSLRSVGVTVDQPTVPEKPASRSRPTAGTANGNAARIDQDDADEEGVEWQVTSNYQDGDDGESEWTLKGRDNESLDAAEALLQEALTHAKSASHVGYLTLTDRSVFPRIVGTKGATVARLRAETGADITVGREDNTIVIVGAYPPT